MIYGFLLDLNLEFMSLGDKVLDLVEGFMKTKTLNSVHLGFNMISKQVLEKIQILMSLKITDDQLWNGIPNSFAPVERVGM